MEFDILSKLGAFPFTQNNGLGIFIGNVIGLLIGLSGVFFLVFLVWGGVQWITSGGEKSSVENARNQITNAAIGLVIVVAAWAIFSVLKTFLGLPNVTSGGGGGGGGGKSVCGGTINCCKYTTGVTDPIKCCEQVANMSSCVVGMCKNSETECQKDFRIDWNCWEKNYPAGGIKNDPCAPTK